MPIYEYRCQGCGHRFELLQRLGQGAEGVACPKCGAERPEKQFSTFASAGGSANAERSGGGEGCGGGGGFT